MRQISHIRYLPNVACKTSPPLLLVYVVSYFRKLVMAMVMAIATRRRRHASLSYARRCAVAKPTFSGCRSISIVLSHDRLGRPGLRLQSAGVCEVQACKAR